VTMRALRRDHTSADSFPRDVQELQGYLDDQSRVPGVEAIPGQGTKVPIYILGSSLFGATLAAALGLPYGFASHFAPAALHEAVARYRAGFRPSEHLAEPYVIAGINAIAAPTGPEAASLLRRAARQRVRLLFGRGGRQITDDEADRILDDPAGQPAWEMLRCRAVGTPDAVVAELERFARDADADELIVASCAPDRGAALRTLELVAAERSVGVS
jgi:luciferase family oxidoreductase group 1